MSEQDDIPYDDIAQFIVQVRKLVAKDYDTRAEYQRVCRRIKNMSTRIFRDHIGYTPEGGYRLKAKQEQMFRDAVEAAGGREGALSEYAGKSPHLARILRGDPPLEPAPGAGEDPPPPLHLVPQEIPDPEWAGEFDPESDQPVGGVRARAADLVDLDALAEEEVEPLEFEAVNPDGEPD